MLPLLVSYRTENIQVIYVTLGVCGLFQIVGYFLSPSIGILAAVTIINRVLGFLTLVLFTIVIVNLVKSKIKLYDYAEEVKLTNRELEAFSYSVSHDLRNPLSTVRGYAALLTENCSNALDSEGRGFLDMISMGLNKMEDLISDLLNLSKISARDLNTSEIDLTQLAKEITEELFKEEPSRNMEIKIEEGMRLTADPNLLRIGLYNLLSNSWKYTAVKEKGVIEVGCVSKPDGKIFFIKDNGAGFDMKYSSKLFEPFKRLHSEKDFPGTGIGLPIVMRVIRKHGGKIWAEGVPGKGAVFYFSLPQTYF
ncbi:Sensory box histidine kinase [Chitinispirillum alkaliphilum]|nr:Sensory box histidine kinase [Chitinispirillum alkaliphilum]